MAEPRLPPSIAPMLAQLGQPFDSDQHYFDIKWDGYRGICLVEAGAHRLLSRRRWNMTSVFPELDHLAQLPAGTVLDGEVIALRDGKPSFQELQRRGQARSPLRIQELVAEVPTQFVVFDLLYERFEPLLERPLVERQERLAELVRQASSPLHLSPGVVGSGLAFFEEARKQGLEGIIAKRLQSSYLPGKRTSAWIKIKAYQTYYCVIIGYLPEGADDFKSLLVATNEGDELVYAGRVGTGFSAATRERLNRELRAHPRAAPLVSCPEKGRWVAAGLYCTVRCMEKTDRRQLRAPAFQELIIDRPT